MSSCVDLKSEKPGGGVVNALVKACLRGSFLLREFVVTQTSYLHKKNVDLTPTMVAHNV